MGSKLTVVVLYGGKSTEHDISRRSAAFVLQNLDRSQYDIQAVGIDQQGNWHPQDTGKLLENLESPVPINDFPLEKRVPPKGLAEEINPTHFFDLYKNNIINSSLSPVAEASAQEAETIYFSVLHGNYGEDGAMQGLFTVADVPFVGSPILGAAIAMDKGVAKKLVRAAGINVVPWSEVRANTFRADHIKALIEAVSEVSFPVFVKPASQGSSIGISRAANMNELDQACRLALSYDNKVLIEKAMDIREIECAVVGGSPIQVSEPGEVIVHSDFYTYEAKYLAQDQATIRVPASLTLAEAGLAKDIARQVFLELELQGMARIDLFVEKESNTFYFNEANSIPGFTAISQYPLLWKSAGKSAGELLDELIQEGLARYNCKYSYSKDLDEDND